MPRLRLDGDGGWVSLKQIRAPRGSHQRPGPALHRGGLALHVAETRALLGARRESTVNSL